MTQVGSDYFSASVTMKSCLALSTGKLEHFFLVDAQQKSVLHSHGPSRGGRGFLNLLRCPREKVAISSLASACGVCLRNMSFTILTQV